MLGHNSMTTEKKQRSQLTECAWADEVTDAAVLRIPLRRGRLSSAALTQRLQWHKTRQTALYSDASSIRKSTVRR